MIKARNNNSISKQPRSRTRALITGKIVGVLSFGKHVPKPKTPTDMKINHIDIKSGLWDHRLPPHEDRLAWIERVPFTWLPELISASIRESIIRGKFTPEEIIDFCKSAAESSGAREDTPLDQITDATSRRLPY